MESWSIRDLAWTQVGGSPFESMDVSPFFIGGFNPRRLPLLLIPHKGGPTIWSPDTRGYMSMRFPAQDRTVAALHFVTKASATLRGTIEISSEMEKTSNGEPEQFSVVTGITDVFTLRSSPDGRFLVALGSEKLAILKMDGVWRSGIRMN